MVDHLSFSKSAGHVRITPNRKITQKNAINISLSVMSQIRAKKALPVLGLVTDDISICRHILRFAEFSEHGARRLRLACVTQACGARVALNPEFDSRSFTVPHREICRLYNPVYAPSIRKILHGYLRTVLLSPKFVLSRWLSVGLHYAFFRAIKADVFTRFPSAQIFFRFRA